MNDSMSWTNTQTEVLLSRVTSSKHPLVKTLWKTSDGVYLKEGKTELTQGKLEVVGLPYCGSTEAVMSAFADIIRSLTPLQALTLGIPGNGDRGPRSIASQARAGEHDLTRTRKDLDYPHGAALMFLDGDRVSDVIGELFRICPMLADCAALCYGSSSSSVIDTETGQSVLDGGGSHGFILIDDARETQNVLYAINRFAWKHGLGWIKIDKIGKPLVRGLVDLSTWGSERFIYAGPPKVVPPLIKKSREIMRCGGKVLDTQAFLAMAAREAPIEEYDRQIKLAKGAKDLKQRCSEQETKYVEERTQRLIEKGVAPEQARQAAKASTRRTLTGSDFFETRSGEMVQISAILFDLEQNVGTVGFDPVEGRDYNNNDTCAQIMPDGKIFSFAHGGIIYRLVHDWASMAYGLDNGQFASVADYIAAAVAIDDEISNTDLTLLHDRASAIFGNGRSILNPIKRDYKKAREERKRQHREAVLEKKEEERVRIEYDPTNITKAVKSIENELALVDPPLVFNYGSVPTIVASRAVVDECKERVARWGLVKPGRERLLSLSPMDKDQAMFTLSERFLFTTVAPDGDVVETPTPRDVVSGWCALPNRRLPPLRALRTVPLINDDGQVFSEPGYYDGIYYDGSAGNIVVPDHPTLADAKQSWDWVFQTFFREFMFERELDKAVLLSLILTIVCRHEFDFVPYFLSKAPVSGSGKTLLMMTVAYVANGVPAPISTYDNEDTAELKKELISRLVAGSQIVIFDNATGEIGNAILDAFATTPLFDGRILGMSKMYVGEPLMTVAFTGNNATVRADSVRRFLEINLNTRMERPEKRKIENPRLIDTVVHHRAELTSKLMTILKAHCLAGMPGLCENFNSHPAWATKIGGCVQWLTGLHPVDCQETLYENDPIRSGQRALYSAWAVCFKLGAWIPVRDVIEMAGGPGEHDLFNYNFTVGGGSELEIAGQQPDIGFPQRRQLREALLTLCEGNLKAMKLSLRLQKAINVPLGNHMLVGKTMGGKWWFALDAR